MNMFRFFDDRTADEQTEYLYGRSDDEDDNDDLPPLF